VHSRGSRRSLRGHPPETGVTRAVTNDATLLLYYVCTHFGDVVAASGVAAAVAVSRAQASALHPLVAPDQDDVPVTVVDQKLDGAPDEDCVFGTILLYCRSLLESYG
jgi:hypothetical protein